MLDLVKITRPRAVMIENVRGLLDPLFDDYRAKITRRLRSLGYATQWKLLPAADYGVAQLRPRVVAVAVRVNVGGGAFDYPTPHPQDAPTVGKLLHDLMASNGWEGADAWSTHADRIAPTLVGGSKKHGGPDLGPTRARAAWAELGVNGSSIADDAPEPGFEGDPRLTVRMAARIQGFPDEWQITGRKTAAYRQVGNAFPPPVAKAVGERITEVLAAANSVVAA